MKNIGEQVIKLINDSLTKIGKSELNEANTKCIKTLIIDLSSKNLLENSVYKLLCKFLELLLDRAIKLMHLELMFISLYKSYAIH
jgi:hypothetical protein